MTGASSTDFEVFLLEAAREQMPSDTMDEAHIVISSHTSDIHFARIVRKFLELSVENVEVWSYEHGLEPGLPVTSQVRRAIRRAAIVIFLVSPSHLDSDEFARDRVMSNKSTHILIPIVVAPCETSSAMNREMGVKRPEWIDISALSDPSRREEWQSVLDSGLHSLLGQVKTALGRDTQEEQFEPEVVDDSSVADALDGPEGDLLDTSADEDEFNPDFVPDYGVKMKKSPMDIKLKAVPLTKRQVGYVLKTITIVCSVVAVCGLMWLLMTIQNITRISFETEHLADKASDTLGLLAEVETALNQTVEDIEESTVSISVTIDAIEGTVADYLDQLSDATIALDAEVEAASDSDIAPVGQFVNVYSKLAGLCDLFGNAEQTFVNLTLVNASVLEILGQSCSIAVKATICDAASDAEQISFCPEFLAATSAGEDVSSAVDGHCFDIASNVAPMSILPQSVLYKYALPTGSVVCAAQRVQTSLSGFGALAIPLDVDDYFDGRGDDLSSPEAFIRMRTADLLACFGQQFNASDAIGVYFEIVESDFDEVLAIYDGGCDGIGAAEPALARVPGLGEGWVLRSNGLKVEDVVSSDGFTFAVDSFELQGKNGSFQYSAFVELYNCSNDACSTGDVVDEDSGLRSGTMASSLRVCGRSLASAAARSEFFSYPTSLCCQLSAANEQCGLGEGGCVSDDDCSGELVCGTANCDHDVPFLPHDSSRRCCTSSVPSCDVITEHGHLNTATDSCCLVPIVSTTCYGTFTSSGTEYTCDSLNAANGNSRDQCGEVSAQVDGLCAGCRCIYEDDEGVGVYDGADFDMFPHDIFGNAFSCANYASYCEDPVYGDVVKSMCGTTCGGAEGPVCAAIPSSGFISISESQCDAPQFPYDNYALMQFGTALLNVSGQCCYHGFASSNATSDFAGFECATYADALCNHPAYGAWMRAVCPESCGACMDQLTTQVTDDTPQYPLVPALYDGQLTTDCSTVAESYLIVQDPNVTSSEFSGSEPLAVSPRVAGAGECCDSECYVCDYYFHWLHAAGNSYSVLTCAAVQSVIASSFPSYTCENCACKLNYDDEALYPAFYCQNV